MSKKASKKRPTKTRPGKTGKPAKKPAPKKSAPKKAQAKKAAKRTGAARAAVSTVMRDRAIGIAEFAHGMTAKFLRGFSDAQLTAQPAGLPNHALWTVGHLAVTAQWLAGMIDGKPGTLPASYDKLFGYGSTPIDDPAAYPPYAEVLREFDSTFARVIDAARALDDAGLHAPCTCDTGGFCSDKLDAINKGAWHEGWHLGQLASLRKALGLPSAMGG